MGVPQNCQLGHDQSWIYHWFLAPWHETERSMFPLPQTSVDSVVPLWDGYQHSLIISDHLIRECLPTFSNSTSGSCERSKGHPEIGSTRRVSSQVWPKSQVSSQKKNTSAHQHMATNTCPVTMMSPSRFDPFVLSFRLRSQPWRPHRTWWVSDGMLSQII